MATDPTTAVFDETAGGSRVRTAVARRPKGIVPGILMAFLLLCAVLALAAPLLGLPSPSAQALENVGARPSADAWLGADQYGRDLLSRLIWGIRTSLFSAAIAVLVAVSVGVPLGLLAAYRQDWIGWSLGRISDTVLTLPALVLLITVQAALQTDIYGQMVVLGLIFSPRVMRVVRNTTLGILDSPYIVAGKLSGCSGARVIARYILPNAREQIIVQATYLFSLALIVESGISYLGIGVQPPRASLGTLLEGGTSVLAASPQVIVIPAAFLVLLILGANLVGDSLAARRKR